MSWHCKVCKLSEAVASVSFDQRFNILFSNVQTTAPSLYNSQWFRIRYQVPQCMSP